MLTTIQIDENTIISGNVEKVKRTIEAIVENSEMIRRYEARVALCFGTPENKRQLGFFDLEKKLARPEYKKWFRQLDRDVPALPYFLSAGEGQNSLLIYLMGVLDFTVADSRIDFETVAAGRLFQQKKTEIKNLCLSNNISPQGSLLRLSTLVCPASAQGSGSSAVGSGPKADGQAPQPVQPATVDIAAPAKKAESAAVPVPQETTPTPERTVEEEKPKETRTLKVLLDRYGSIAVFKENRMTKIFIVLKEIPPQIALQRNELVFDRSVNRWFFRTAFQTGAGELAVESLLLYKPGEVADSIAAHGGVLVMCVCRGEDGEYQKLFEIEDPVPTAIVEEEGGVTPPPVPPTSDDGDKHEAPADDAAAGPADPKDREIAALRSEIERLKGIIEAYEDTMLGKNKKSIFKKFFG